MMLKSSMPIFFPDEESRRAVLDANHLDDSKINKLIFNCKIHAVHQCLYFCVGIFVLSLLLGCIYDNGLLSRFVSDEILQTIEPVVMFTGYISALSLLLFVVASVLCIAMVRMRNKHQSDARYNTVFCDVTDGKFAGYKVILGRSASSEKRVVVTYMSSDNKKQRASTSENNFYFLSKMQKGAGLKVVQINVWGIPYSYVFLEDFFQIDSSLKSNQDFAHAYIDDAVLD